MSATRCGTCGALEGVQWSRGHAPTCEQYRPPRSARLCPVCSLPVRVARVQPAVPPDIGQRAPAAVVEFACARCPDVAWTETTEADEEDVDSLEDPAP